MSELTFSYCRDDEPNFCGPLAIKVRSDGFGIEWNTYVSEQWLTDLGIKLRPYPLPSEGIVDRLMYGTAEVFAISLMPKGPLGVLVAKVKVHDVINGLDQRAEVSLITDYASVERFSRSLVAAARAGSGEAKIVNQVQ